MRRFEGVEPHLLAARDLGHVIPEIPQVNTVKASGAPTRQCWVIPRQIEVAVAAKIGRK
jgi:hypothetical protein